MLMFYQPVNKFLHCLVNVCGAIAGHVLLKFFTYTLTPNQVENAPQADGFVEECIASCTHVQYDILNLAEAMRKVLFHIISVQGELLVDSTDRTSILGKQIGTLLNRNTRLIKQTLHYAEGAK